MSVTFFTTINGRPTKGGEEFNLANGNARPFLALLGFDTEDLMGSCDIPTARRALVRARATFDRVAPSLTRDGGTTYGAPRVVVYDGIPTIERPARVIEGGLTQDRIANYVEFFAELVDAAQEDEAEEIAWG